MNVRDLLVSLMLTSIACSASEAPRFVALPSMEADVVFVLGLDAQAQIVEIEGPILSGMNAAMAASATLVSEPAELLFLGWTQEDLLEATPLYEPARAGALELSLGETPSCEPGLLEGPGANFLMTAAPKTTVAMRLVLGETAKPSVMPAGLRLRVPVEAESCLPEAQRVLRPFADRLSPIPVGSMVDGLSLGPAARVVRQLRLLRDGRLLVLGGNWLFLMERDMPLRLDAAHAVFFPDVIMTTMDIDEDEARNPSGVLVSAVGVYSGLVTGALFDLRVTADGLSMIARTELGTRVDDLVIRPFDGRLVAVSGLGDVLVRASADASIESIDDVWPDTGNLPRVGLTGDPERPYAAGGSGRAGVVLADPTGKVWTPGPSTGLDISSRVRALSKVPEGDREVWVGTSDGRLFYWRMDTEAWRSVPMPLPPSFAACGVVTECGFAEATTTLRNIIPHQRGGSARAFVSLSDCVGLIEARLDGRCASVLRMGERAIDDLSPGLKEGEYLDFRVVDFRDGRLVVGSQEGEIYTLDVDPAN